MEYIMLAVATTSNVAKTLAWKKIGNANHKGAGVHLVNAVIFFFSALTLLLLGLCTRQLSLPSLPSVLLGVLYALFSTLTQILLLKAMGMGEASMTQLVYSLGILLPITYSAIFLDEPIVPMQLVGVALVFVALYFITNPKGGKGKFNALWLILALLSAAGSGAIGIVQKIHQTSEFKSELQTFVLISLISSALFSLILYLIGHKKAEGAQVKIDGKYLGFLALCGLCVGVLNLSSAMCTGLLPAMVQFPVYNIGSMVLVGVGGYLIFKERLSSSQLIGFAIGCTAILLIGLF